MDQAQAYASMRPYLAESSRGRAGPEPGPGLDGYEAEAEGLGPSSRGRAVGGKRTASAARKILENMGPEDLVEESLPGPQTAVQMAGRATAYPAGPRAQVPRALEDQLPPSSSQHICDACESTAARFYCLACKGWFCANCDKSVHSNRLLQRHERIPASDYVAPVLCTNHAGEICTHFCASCQQLCCVICLVDGPHIPGSVHGEHRLQPLSGAVDVVRSELASAEENLGEKLHSLTEADQALQKAKVDLSTTCAIVKDTISKAFAELRAKLDHKEQELTEHIRAFADNQGSDIDEKQLIIAAAEQGVRSLRQSISQHLFNSQTLGSELARDQEGSSILQASRLSIFRATNLIKFYLQNQGELEKGTSAEAKSAISAALAVAETAKQPRECYVDIDSANKQIDAIMNIQLEISSLALTRK